MKLVFSFMFLEQNIEMSSFYLTNWPSTLIWMWVRQTLNWRVFCWPEKHPQISLDVFLNVFYILYFICVEKNHTASGKIINWMKQIDEEIQKKNKIVQKKARWSCLFKKVPDLEKLEKIPKSAIFSSLLLIKDLQTCWSQLFNT